jgi:hypothetical protein
MEMSRTSCLFILFRPSKVTRLFILWAIQAVLIWVLMSIFPF